MDHLPVFSLGIVQKKVTENPIVASAAAVTGIACLILLLKKTSSNHINITDIDYDNDFMSSEQDKEQQKHLMQILKSKKKESKNKRSNTMKKHIMHNSPIIKIENPINSNIKHSIQHTNEEEKYPNMNNHEYIHPSSVTNEYYSSPSVSAEPVFSANQYFGGVNIRPQYTARQTTGPWKYLFDVYNHPQQQQKYGQSLKSNAYQQQNMQSNGIQTSAVENINSDDETDDEVPMHKTENDIKRMSSLQFMREKYAKKPVQIHRSPLLSTDIGLSFGASAEQNAIQNDLNEDNSLLGGIKQMKEMISIERKQ